MPRSIGSSSTSCCRDVVDVAHTLVGDWLRVADLDETGGMHHYILPVSIKRGFDEAAVANYLAPAAV